MNDPVLNLVPSPIAIAVEPSQDALVVGLEFSVFVEITNHLADGAVTILEVEPLVPPQIALQPMPRDSRDPPQAPAQPAPSPRHILQPGNSMQRQFYLRHKPSVFVGPSSRQLGFNVRYRVGAKEAVATAELDLSFRPPLRYLILGAVVGTLVAFFVGSYAQLLPVVEAIVSQNPESLQVGPVEVVGAMLLTLIAGVVAVIAAQSTRRGITIEDFWGGAITGFTVVLASSQLFQLITPSPGSGGFEATPGSTSVAAEPAAAPVATVILTAVSDADPAIVPGAPAVAIASATATVDVPGQFRRIFARESTAPAATPVPD